MSGDEIITREWDWVVNSVRSQIAERTGCDAYSVDDDLCGEGVCLAWQRLRRQPGIDVGLACWLGAADAVRGRKFVNGNDLARWGASVGRGRSYTLPTGDKVRYSRCESAPLKYADPSLREVG